MDARVTHARTDSSTRIDRLIAQAGNWMMRHQLAIQRLQWSMLALYFVLAVIPPFLPAPGPNSHLWSNLTLFAQFVFWGIWQPFVLVSIVMAGRLWCGALCPEGALSEHVSRHSQGWATSKWMIWKGWPFVSFCLIMICSQMVSAYREPKGALMILGASVVAAVATGLLYARNKRVWCRYFCPMSSLFGVVAKLAPLHYRVDQNAWIDSHKPTVEQSKAANCAPLIAVRTMRGASECHMCGRCSGYRGAVVLARRSPNHEIIHVARGEPRPWETRLITLGMIGLVSGALNWSFASKVGLFGGGWITVAEVMAAHMAVATVFFGGGALGCVAIADRALGGPSFARFHHLAQSLIPVAACVVFLAFSQGTMASLRVEGLGLSSIDAARAALPAGAAGWSLFLGWRITRFYSDQIGRRLAALAALGGAAALAVASWATPL